MAQVQYAVLQKPLADRIVDAACVYWETTPEALTGAIRSTAGDAATRRRYILFFLLARDAEMTYEAIANRFGSHKSAVSKAVGDIESQQAVYRTVSEQLSAIRRIAENLNAQLVTIDVRLEHIPAVQPAP